jgi:hypothetical protein
MSGDDTRGMRAAHTRRAELTLATGVKRRG